jgi:hypothetical protein
MKPLPISIPNVQFTKTGLMFNDAMTGEEWAAVWPQLKAMTDGLQWAIGDWLIHGERNNFGEKYSAQIEITGYKYKSLANMAAVCRGVHFSLRRENLSYGHHAVISSMEPKEQKRWLDEAEAKSLSVEELSAQVSAAKGRPVIGSPLNLFVPSKWITAGMDWFRSQFEKQPIEQWPQDRRDMLKRDLKPVVDIYEKL